MTAPPTPASPAWSSAPGNHNAYRRRARGRHRKDAYANAGSMPNLAQPDTHCYSYQPPRPRPTTTAYYVTGYPAYVEPEPAPYTNGAYTYDNEMEGHYSVNPSYHPTTAPAYRGQDAYSRYGNDELDSMSQNPYATLRPPRNRPVPRSNEQVTKNIQKALVAEHLRGWYQRNTVQKQPAYDYEYDRGSQQSLGYQTMPSAYSHNSRTMAYSPAPSAGNWHGHMGGGMAEYDIPVHAPQSYSYGNTHYGHTAHNRSYIDVNQMDSHLSSQTNSDFDPEEQICWHESSKPGTIV